MDPKVFLTVFATVFVAELGDKTQLATVLFAARNDTNLFGIFLAASSALVVSAAIGVAAGALVSSYIDPKYLAYIAGIGFILIGAFTIWQA